MKNTKKSQNVCDETTNEIYNKFKMSYDKLLQGQKQLLHNLIISQLQIPPKECTIRAYCSNFNRIPRENQKFFIKLIYGSLITLFNQLIDKWENDISDSKTNIKNLSQTLKEYGKK